MSNIDKANEALNAAGLAILILIQRAYDAGQAYTNEARERGHESAKPAAAEVNAALRVFDAAAVGLAHARMEETAKRCGFEGLTEALGYLITLRDNPVATLLREAVNLAALGDIDENTEAYGWGHWYKRAKAVVGDTAPPPETINFDEELRKRDVGMRPELAADFGPSVGTWPQMYGRGKRPEPEPQVLSGCAVRAAIQVDEAAVHAVEEAEHDARMAELYGKPQDDGGEGSEPVTGSTEADTGGATTDKT